MEPTPPEPIPAEGRVQIFSSPECTQYATGVTDTIYVRINEPWTTLNAVSWPPPPENDTFEFRIAPISFIAYNNFRPTQTGPYTAGQVVKAQSLTAMDVTEMHKSF